MFDFSLCASLVRWVWELRLFAMPDDQSRCDGSVTAINAVVQDMSTGEPTLRCLVRHSNPEPRWQAWVKTGKAQNERMFSGSPPIADIAATCRHVQTGQQRSLRVMKDGCYFGARAGGTVVSEFGAK
jgi:hypothetical protein